MLEPSARMLPTIYKLQLDKLNNIGLHNKVSKAQSQAGAVAATAFVAANFADDVAAERSDRSEPAAIAECLLPPAVMLPCHLCPSFSPVADAGGPDGDAAAACAAATDAADATRTCSLARSHHSHQHSPLCLPTLIPHYTPHSHPHCTTPACAHRLPRSPSLRLRTQAARACAHAHTSRGFHSHTQHSHTTHTRSFGLHHTHTHGDGCRLSQTSPGRLAHGEPATWPVSKAHAATHAQCFGHQCSVFKHCNQHMCF